MTHRQWRSMDRHPQPSISRRRFLGTTGGTMFAVATSRRAATAQGTPAATDVRQVRDPAGRDVLVPVNPQRVVALDPNRTIVNLVEVGVIPVGATTNPTNPEGGFAPVLADVAAQIEPVGMTGSADLEQIVNLAPDLIFYASAYQDIPLEILEGIAPTVSYPAPGSNVTEHLAFVGDVVGKPEAARQVAADFAATIAAERDTLGLAGLRTGIMALYNTEGSGAFGANGPDSVLGALVVDLGATLVPAMIGGEPLVDYSTDLSLEVAGEIFADAEVLIATRYGGSAESDANFDETIASPLWRLIPAVASGKTAVLDIQPAFGNWGVRGLELALAELNDQLGPVLSVPPRQ